MPKKSEPLCEKKSPGEDPSKNCNDKAWIQHWLYMLYQQYDGSSQPGQTVAVKKMSPLLYSSGGLI